MILLKSSATGSREANKFNLKLSTGTKFYAEICNFSEIQ